RGIRPALARGEWVLCDRFAESTVAYQGYGRGIDRAFLEAMGRFVQQEIVPDRVLLLDLPPEVGLARARARAGGGEASRFEQELLSFHRRVRQGFLELAQAEPERIRVIDG
ncbi:MAG: dTMP kinase, partial [Magnetococcales bacterium]|nr:dTMP kinase [Magnetococcales bacterium]